jgi:hypothetical protein
LVTDVKIGTNVYLGKDAIGNNFESYYASTGMQAGTYKFNNFWTKFDSRGTVVHSEALVSFKEAAIYVAIVVGAILILALIGSTLTDGVDQ